MTTRTSASPTRLAATLAPPREITVFERRRRAFWRRPMNRLSLGIVGLIVLLALLPVNWLRHDPTLVNLSLYLKPGFWAGNFEYPLGTDFLGRDLLDRLIFATRYTLTITLMAEGLSTLIGLVLGMMAGYYGHWVDTVISRLVDLQLAFPVILLAIAVVGLLGGSFLNLIIVLAITGWAGTTRVIRGTTMTIRNQDFIEAARAVGVKNTRILFGHILPNVVSSVVILSTFGLARILLTESALSFLGLGVTPPQATWGGMIGDGRNNLYEALWISAIPGTAITLTVLAFNFIGDGLRDAFDPFSSDQ
ncbi:MAG: ABC transporter permease [Anaerolineae bacterium]|nr:ABC transporter permease [Anaerolineae bacterium]